MSNINDLFAPTTILTHWPWWVDRAPINSAMTTMPTVPVATAFPVRAYISQEGWAWQNTYMQFNYYIARMSTDSLMGKYVGSTDSLTGTYLGYGMYVLFALPYHIPVQLYWLLTLTGGLSIKIHIYMRNPKPKIENKMKKNTSQER